MERHPRNHRFLVGMLFLGNEEVCHGLHDFLLVAGVGVSLPDKVTEWLVPLEKGVLHFALSSKELSRSLSSRVSHQSSFYQTSPFHYGFGPQAVHWGLQETTEAPVIASTYSIQKLGGAICILVGG